MATARFPKTAFGWLDRVGSFCRRRRSCRWELYTVNHSGLPSLQISSQIRGITFPSSTHRYCKWKILRCYTLEIELLRMHKRIIKSGRFSIFMNSRRRIWEIMLVWRKSETRMREALSLARPPTIVVFLRALSGIRACTVLLPITPPRKPQIFFASGSPAPGKNSNYYN